MSIRMYNRTNREYIKQLLDELEIDKDYIFSIEIEETRANGVIKNLNIKANIEE